MRRKTKNLPDDSSSLEEDQERQRPPRRGTKRLPVAASNDTLLSPNTHSSPTVSSPTASMGSRRDSRQFMRTDGGSGLTSPVMNTEETPLIPPRKRSVQKDTHSSGSSSAGRASGGRTESSASSGFNAPEVWKDKDQSPKNFQEYASVFLVSLRNQSKIHFTLSLLYHLIHIALILSFVFSPILTRSVTFSSSSMSHRLLQAQGIIAPKSSDADSANKDKPPTPVVDSTKYAIESVWSIHDGLFFLEPGHAIVPVSIEESFQKLPNTKKKKRKGKNELNGGKKEDNKGSNSNQGDDDDDEDNNQNEHTYVTEDTVEEATDNGVSQLLAGGKVFTYASPAPIVSNGRHWKKKGSGETASISKMASAWLSSPLYSSPLALTVYYYIYCVACGVFLLVGSEGRLTGHLSIIRLVVGLFELVWYFHHGAHSFLIYCWLVVLSHWKGEKNVFLEKGSPYVTIHTTDSSAAFHLFYRVKTDKDGMNGVALRDEALNMNTYLYDMVYIYKNVAVIVDVLFLCVILFCCISDLQRVLNGLMGVRDLWEPDGFVRCPLCGELLERAADTWYDGLLDWLAAFLCQGGQLTSVSRRIVKTRNTKGRKTEGITPAPSASIYTELPDERLNIDVDFYNAVPMLEASTSGSLKDSLSTDSSEEDANEGGIVKVIVQKEGEEEKDAKYRKGVAEQRLLLAHSTRHVCHRCPKLFLDVTDSDEEDSTTSEEDDETSDSEDDAKGANPPRAHSPPRRVVPRSEDPIKTPPEQEEAVPEGVKFNFSFTAADYGTMMKPSEKRVHAVVDRVNMDALKDGEDEFRPGNAFPSYEKASWLSRITYSWLNPLLKFALLEPTLLRHERFLPALPSNMTSFDNIYITSWQYWVHRKVWFGQYATKTGDALIPTEEALEQAEEYFNLADLTLGRDEDEEEEDEEASSADQTVIILEPKQLKNSKLRHQKPKRSFTERALLAVTSPFRFIGRKIFFYMYIGRSHTIRRTRERLVRALLKDRLVALHEETGGYEGLWALAEMASSKESSSVNSAGSILPSYIRRHLALRDVSLFFIFMEHPVGRRFLYVAGPILFLYDIFSLMLIPIIGKICYSISFQPQYLDGFGTDKDLDDSNGVATALRWCFVLFIVLTAQSVTYQEYWNQVSECVMEARTAIRTMVLEKVMNLSLAQCPFSEGELINLVTIEATRIGDSLLTLHYTWSNPFLIIAIGLYIYFYLGTAPAVAALIVVACVVPLMRSTAAKVRLAHHHVPSSSHRVSLITEALSDMRQVKALLMEALYALRIKDCSKNEAEGEYRVTLWRAVAGMISEASTALLVVVSFGTYAAVGGALDPVILLPALAALSTLWTPISEFPSLFSSVSRGYLSMKRIEAVLRQSPDQFVGTWMDMTVDQPFKKPYRRGSIVCKGCSFTWDHDLGQQEPQPVLNDVHMKVLPGELVVVQGSLDSAKDSLLLAILGEINRCIDPNDQRMNFDDTASEFSVVSHSTVDSSSRHYLGNPYKRKSSPTLSPAPHPVDCESDEDAEISAADGFLVFGSCVYCPATPWLQNDTIRGNITSGKMVSSSQMNRRWYRTVVRACALDKDFDNLPKGDQTVVGDKGMQLSMGQKVRVALARALFAKADIYLLDSVLGYLDQETQRHIIREVFQKILKHKTVVLVSNVGLSQLQPHRIFTVTDDGDVREDTSQYREVQSDNSDGHSDDTRHSVATDEGDKDRGSPTEVKGDSFANHSIFSDDVRYPALYAEEYEEAEPVPDIIPGVMNDDDDDFQYDPFHTISDDEFEESSEDDDSDLNVSATTFNSETTTVTGSEEEESILSRGSNPRKEKLGQRRFGSEKESFRLFAAFMGVQAFWLFMAAAVQQLLHLSMDVWLAYWLSIARWTPSMASTFMFFVLFAGLGVFSALFVIPRVQMRYFAVQGTIRRVYHLTIESVLRAPVSFFDLRTSASITNILTRDMEVAVTNLPESLDVILSCATQLVGVLLFNSIVNPAFVLVLPITILLFLGVTQRFLVASREVRRLNNRSVSGIVAILKEVLQGAPLVRCFSMQDSIREEYCRALDTTNTGVMIVYMVDRWVSLRLQLLTVFMCTAAAVFGVLMSTSLASPSFVGVAIITCLRSGRILTTLCRKFATFKGEWVSMQAIIDLFLVPAEPLAKGTEDMETFSSDFAEFGKNNNAVDLSELDARDPLIRLVNTPQHTAMKEGEQQLDANNNSDLYGEVPLVRPVLELVNVSASYHPSLPLALHHLNLAVYPRERVGFVGRTGNGKSTIFNVLLRLINMVEGYILLKGEPTDGIPYPVLRSWFATVPQDPLLVTGTWRSNLLMGFHTKEEDAVVKPFALPPATDLSSSSRLVSSLSKEYKDDDEMFTGSGRKDETPPLTYRRRGKRTAPRVSRVSPAIKAAPRLGQDAALWRALDAVGLSAKVELDGGLDATISEDGRPDTTLTDVQRQLLCLARAVLRKPPFILLDDPATSGGDLHVDCTFRRVLNDELKDSTVLIIAHRMSTVLQLCTRVVVIEDGTVSTVVDGLAPSPEASLPSVLSGDLSGQQSSFVAGNSGSLQYQPSLSKEKLQSISSFIE